MNSLHATITASLTEKYTALAAQVRELAAPLNDTQFWRKPYPYGNSFGHLVLHLTGNLNYYIGAQIAATGYVRDRDREFAETVHPSKEETLKRFDEAIAMVVRTIGVQSADDWSKDYVAAREDARNRFDIFLRCATHLHHHVGQMIYLGFEFKRQGPV